MHRPEDGMSDRYYRKRRQKNSTIAIHKRRKEKANQVSRILEEYTFVTENQHKSHKSS